MADELRFILHFRDKAPRALYLVREPPPLILEVVDLWPISVAGRLAVPAAAAAVSAAPLADGATAAAAAAAATGAGGEGTDPEGAQGPGPDPSDDGRAWVLTGRAHPPHPVRRGAVHDVVMGRYRLLQEGPWGGGRKSVPEREKEEGRALGSAWSGTPVGGRG